MNHIHASSSFVSVKKCGLVATYCLASLPSNFILFYQRPKREAASTGVCCCYCRFWAVSKRRCCACWISFTMLGWFVSTPVAARSLPMLS